MQISWDLIRTFEAVAKTGSLSAAARMLQLTQPTVGRHVDLLEEALNVALYVRSREGMRLTDKGEDLVVDAKEMLASAVGLERRATGLDEDLSGVVRISANEIFGVMVLPRIMPRFMDVNPDIDIELIVSNSVANLMQRDADVSVRMFRPTQNDLIARKITELPLGLFAHRDYLTAHPAPQKLRDLHEHRFIGFDRETSLIDVARSLGESFTSSDFIFRSDSILAHFEAIRSGVGIGVTHKGLAVHWPEVEQVLPKVKLPKLDLWITCHSEVRHNKRIRLLMDFLAHELGDPYSHINV